MLRFFDLERIEAKKRDVVERIKDFDEIYEIFQPNKSKEQSERCIQCVIHTATMGVLCTTSSRNG